MILLGILAFIALAGPAVALAKHMNRPVRSGGRARGSSGRPGGRTASPSRPAGTGPAGTARPAGRATGKYQRPKGEPSWVIKAWNASGAPVTDETTIKGASAVVTGKATGGAVRWVKRVFHSVRNPGPTGPRPADDTQQAGDPQPAEATPQDVTREPDSPPAGQMPDRERELNELKLAFHEQQLKDMVAAYELLCAEDAIGPAEAAEHMVARGQAEYEIARLRRALGRDTTPTPKPKPARTPPPARINPFRPDRGATPVTTPSTFDRAAVPPTLAAHLNYIAELHPENDAEILNFLKTEVTGMLAYAEAVNTFFEHCVTGEGLDPAAMQGVSDYAEAFAENASAAANGHKQFLAVYEAIIEAASNGTVMPYNGRFFSGESAA